MHPVSFRGFGETSNHPLDSAPLQPRSGTLWFLAFPKTKIAIEREEIADCRDSGKYDDAADGAWGELCEVPRCLLWRDWGVNVLCTMFLVSCVFFNKCLYFSYYMAGYLLNRPHMFLSVEHSGRRVCCYYQRKNPGPLDPKFTESMWFPPSNFHTPRPMPKLLTLAAS